MSSARESRRARRVPARAPRLVPRSTPARRGASAGRAPMSSMRRARAARRRGALCHAVPRRDPGARADGGVRVAGRARACCRAPAAGRPVASDGEIGDWWPRSGWAERELLERDGARQVGRALGAAADQAGRGPDRPTVTGLDVFAIPFGPVRSGIFEAIQFQIETGGEDVPRLQTRPFFKHRGIEHASPV